MGTNRRYGPPSERAYARRQRETDYLPHEPRIRHVWVRSSNRDDAHAWPGLVIAWRRDRPTLDRTGWRAQVAYTPGNNDNLTVTWIDAEDLLPNPSHQ